MSSAVSIRFFETHRLLLVDPLAESTHPLLGEAAGVVLAHPRVVADASALPRVVDAKTLDAATLDALILDIDVATDRGDDVGHQAAIDTDLSAAALAHHLGAQSVRSLTGTESHLVRIWDPHVLVHLRWIWPEAAWRRLLAPMRRWTFFARGERVDLEAEMPMTEGLTTASEQARAVLDIGLYNAALRTMDWTLSALPAIGRKFMAHLAVARAEHGLDDNDDLALYLAHACRWGDGYHLHSSVRGALELTTDGETRYRDALAQLDDITWSRTRDELDRAARAA